MSSIKDLEKASVADGSITEVKVDARAASKDKARQLLLNHNVNFEPNSVEAKRVLRKIDMRIMPMCFCVYLLMLLDKSGLSFAGIMGLRQETGLNTFQFSWLGSIVYFGYLAGELPGSYMMQRLSLCKYFSIMCMLWGIVVLMHAVCNNFATFLVVRFLLGFAEVCTAPAVIIILGSWYTKTEQVLRVALWYTTSGFSNIFGGFFAWCIFQANSFRWQALFLFYGSLTFITGVVLYFFLAVSPTEAKWLTDDEKVIALERVRSNKTGTEVWRFNWSQLKETFLDPRLYIIFLLLASTGLPNGGLTVFGPEIIGQFGFDTEQTTLLSMVPGFATVIGTGVALVVAKYTNRTIAGIWTVALACIGVIMMFTIPKSNPAGRYGGYIITLQFPIAVLFIVTFMTAGVSGSTKKVAFGASYQLGFTFGSIVGPLTYTEKDGPEYLIAKYTMLVSLLIAIGLLASLGLIHKRWNDQRDKQDALDAQNGVMHEVIENEEFADLTDFQMRSFRYPL
ncbi:hypothetical protein GL218_03970 [Daldinia childiae]|uniref:uncharacterized protein n=1 Tax=Daldinia childiae TaxID=326645 RepID=UPI001447AAB3|nr:uncharacterized protein GL218_03970 [Daldinia childiae]KAF3062064.1 hypothetical protein GL218_03970 [Daldinia childiae]